MAKIYAPPAEIGDCPFNHDTWQSDYDAYMAKLTAWAKQHGDHSAESGDSIRFEVEDGYAEYVVLSLKPLKLIHVPFADGYQFEFAHRLTAKDVRERIRQHKAITELFAKKAKG